jgi:hypothetical protein
LNERFNPFPPPEGESSSVVPEARDNTYNQVAMYVIKKSWARIIIKDYDVKFKRVNIYHPILDNHAHKK